MKGFGSATEVSWHYTDARQLLPLIKSKALKPTMGYSHRGEHPVVWFTRADTYEPMAYPAWLDENGIRHVMASEKEIATRANGLLRIGVAADDPCLRPLSQWTNSRRPENQNLAEEMLNVAKELGSNPVANWQVSFKPVTQKRWLHFQIAFPENVGEAGVLTWSEWDLRAQYTKDLLKMGSDSLICDEGISCECCEPDARPLPGSNPLQSSLDTLIHK